MLGCDSANQPNPELADAPLGRQMHVAQEWVSTGLSVTKDFASNLLGGERLPVSSRPAASEFDGFI